MKTLDEIIKRVETQINDFDKNGCFECHYCGDECCIDSCFLEDALHYLKEYQILQTAYIKAMADLEDNPPLTWSELKQMEGKPVWVESTNKAMHDWFLVDYTIKDNNEDIVWLVTGYAEHVCLHEKTCGKHWQAYRKERTDAHQ